MEYDMLLANLRNALERLLSDSNEGKLQIMNDLEELREEIDTYIIDLENEIDEEEEQEEEEEKEKSVEEVARMLDLPEGTVKSHLHRARLALAARMKE